MPLDSDPNPAASRSALARLASDYAAFFRTERRARAYLVGALIDDVGIAVSAWATTLMKTNLVATQQARATLMLPTLVCFLLGTLISGPLADWMARSSAARLAHWRWKVVLAGRLVETGILAFLVASLASGPPTVARILPYVMVSAFMKTGLRATRVAFSVDLLSEESPSRDRNGAPLKDERGDPLRYKTHLVTFSSVTSLLSTLAILAGLLLGGVVMERAGGRTWNLFAFDVLTNLGFIAALYFGCKPPPDAASASASIETATLTAAPEGRLRHFGRSFADGFRFLAQPAQRPLVALLAGAWLVEIITESYNSEMVIKHVLHGSDDSVRYAALAGSAVAALGALLLPLIVHRVGSLGKIFLVAMFVDGLVIAVAGKIAGAGAATAVVPFAAVLCFDQSLTLVSGTMAEVAQNSVSSAAMRGRIAGTYTIFVILGDMVSEALAAVAEEKWGIPGLIVRAGLLQVVLVSMIALAGGRRLWSFGLHVEGGETPARPLVALTAGEAS
jgi:hypothetical protein